MSRVTASGRQDRPLRVVTCILLLSTGMAHGACTNPPAAVGATRAVVDAQCPCATATSHREYVECVAGAAKSAIASGSLPKQCRRAVVHLRRPIDLRPARLRLLLSDDHAGRREVLSLSGRIMLEWWPSYAPRYPTESSETSHAA
jgi:hypothetical protein